MSHELEEQQRLAYELREQLKSMEIEERTLDEKVKTLEAKIVVQDLLEQVKAKREVLNQLRNRIEELESKIKSHVSTQNNK